MKKIAHISKTAELEANFKTGAKTKALCGIKRRQIHAPKGWPVCPRCVDVLMEERAKPTYTYRVATSNSNGVTEWRWLAA